MRIQALLKGLALIFVCCKANADVVLDVSRDYSTNSNPNPIWSYGYKPTISGAFTPLPHSLVQNYGALSVIHRWLKTPAGGPPSVQKNIGTNHHRNLSEGWDIAPGVVWFGPGSGNDDAYCTIRCVIPSDGRYSLKTAVRTYIQGPISGDCDFHVLKNGTALFDQFLPPTSATSYSNTLQLVTGDVIDFVVGRGADNSSYASGLEINATLTSGTQVPEPPALTLDLANDYSTNRNPGTVWSYGWKTSFDSAFNVLPVSLIQNYGPGHLIHRWIKTTAGGPPSINKNIGTVNSISDGGAGNIPPGVVWFGPGQEGTAETYGVIRCVIPASGAYRLETTVRTYLDGPVSGDCDFHVLKNGAELFGQFMPGSSATSYSNTLSLSAGDVVEFAVGRGADNRAYASGLKIAATLKQVSSTPTVSGVLNLQRDYTTNQNPNAVWAYGYSPSLGGSLTVLPVSLIQNYGGGNVVHRWLKTSAGGPPSVQKNIGTANHISDGGQGNIAPGVVWFGPGSGSNDQFCVIRCTVPTSDTYRLETAVRTYLEGPISGDCDFHVLKNGVELFGQFLPGTSGTGYSNTLDLAAGDRIDFAVGRGADNSSYASGLKIQAILTPTDELPPPPPPPPSLATFDVSRDFSTASNPNGPWSYGWLTTFGGPFGLLSYQYNFAADNGVPLASWLLSSTQLPIVVKNVGSSTARSDGDHFTAPAGTVYFAPGQDGSPQNFGVIRFTVPAGAEGDYRIETSVRSLFDGTRSRDADFHVVKNGQELFGQFMSPNSATGYSNTVHLAAGDTVDFAVGKGADGVTADTGLKIHATLTRAGGPPPPPPGCGFDLAGDFSTNGNPGGAWSYGYMNALGSGFTLLTYPQYSPDNNGLMVFSWSKNGYEPVAVYKNQTTQTSISDGGYGVYPPGTVWFYGGVEGNVDNFGVIRFTVPAEKAGTYRLETAVRTYLDGPLSSDADFYVLRNGAAVFSELLGPNSGTGYTNTFALAAGDTIDFVCGRGQDNRIHNSGLKIRATLHCTGEPPLPGECAPIARRGLVSWWRGEGNANDSIGSNHGQLRNGAGFAPGKVGQGFRFDGVDDFVFIPDSPTLDLTNEISMEMWFKSEAWGNGLTYALVDKRTYNDCNYGAVVSEPWGFQLYYNDPNVFGGDHPGNIHEISSYYPLPALNVFHHFAGTFRQVDPTHIELKTYLDGVLVQTRLFSGNLRNTVNNQAVVIGNGNGGTGTSFKGVIDEVTLYNRALNAAEVAAIHRAGSNGKCVPTGQNTPPSAHIALSPQLQMPGAPHALVVACDGRGGDIVLDGTGSTDPDGDVLTYAWFATGSQQPFSTASVAHIPADAGLHSVTLRVSDAQSSAHATLVFELISPAEAAAQLGLMLEAADLSRKNKAPLQASLRAAISALEDGKFGPAINQLGAFDNKVQVQLGGEHAALAQQLSTATQALIATLEDCAEHTSSNGN